MAFIMVCACALELASPFESVGSDPPVHDLLCMLDGGAGNMVDYAASWGRKGLPSPGSAATLSRGWPKGSVFSA